MAVNESRIIVNEIVGLRGFSQRFSGEGLAKWLHMSAFARTLPVAKVTK